MKPCSTTLSVAIVGATLVLAPVARIHAQATSGPEPLDERVRAAIAEALADERRGEAFYARVLKDHGEVRPFTNIVRAEARHAGFLADLLQARGLAVPEAGTLAAPAHASVKEACTAAVVFETTNVALYDRLLAAGPLPDDVKRAFDHNRMASLEHHTPAFERCASGSAAPDAAGAGWHRGHSGRGHGPRACGNGCSECGHCHGRHGCQRP
jgi:hypothetical protein